MVAFNSLHGTSFDPAVDRKCTTPTSSSYLTKKGANRNFPKLMIPVSPNAGGLGLKSLELEQGLERLSHMASLWSSPTPSILYFGPVLNFSKLKSVPAHSLYI